MNLAIPKTHASEVILHIWKIIDLPNISKKDLLYILSFDLFIWPPDKAIIFVNKCIKSKFLIEDEKKNVSLAPNLKKKLKAWHVDSFQEISYNLEISRKNKSVIEMVGKNEKDEYGILLKAFSDKGTINRATSVSEDAFDITTFDYKTGKIIAKVAGSQKGAYKIIIDTNEKIICHDCQDFISKRMMNQKFCKHLTRLFLLLKERDKNSATDFLKEFARSIDYWNFTDKCT